MSTEHGCHTGPTPAGGSLPSQVQAILFDMDDTLVDSERAWVAAANRLWTEGGATWPAPVIPGGTIEDLAKAYQDELPGADLQATTARLLILLDEELGDHVSPMPGAAELVGRINPALPIAVASNSPSAVVRRTITALGWDSRFRAMLGTDDVAHPKPAPDLYQEAARRCGAEPEHCLIFEDSPMGAQAALATGAFVVTLGRTTTGDAVVPDLLDPLITSWNPEPLS
ncbi:HAD family hydrolase [Actinomyces faecalis]|uniref:HAD family hydrolase n=1 Tax=Actinomyces faecalis TaxID=2722820 RepID=UPI001557A511|nr:HAD family phosphatase [Actinomyces faecalis]